MGRTTGGHRPERPQQRRARLGVMGRRPSGLPRGRPAIRSEEGRTCSPETGWWAERWRKVRGDFATHP